MDRKNRYRQVQRKLFIGIGYPFLVLAALCTMIPLLWLFSSSFKSAEEVFAVPVKLFPKLPPRVSSSPYVIKHTNTKIQKPISVSNEKWQSLQLVIMAEIWQLAKSHISESLLENTPELTDEIRNEMVVGLWQQHVANLPQEIWNESDDSILNTVRSVIIHETINTILDSIYRQVSIGIIEIEDMDFNKTEIESYNWTSDSTAFRQLGASNQVERITPLFYDFQEDNKVVLSTSISSPVSLDRIRRIIIPVKGDASYHRLSLTASKGSAIYKPTEPFVLDTALWNDSVWRLQGVPGELESSDISMLQHFSKEDLIKSVAPPPDTRDNLFLQITIHRPTYLSIVWNKLTANYRNLWKAVPYNRYFINSVFIATASTLLTLFFCSLGGYAFAKYQFKGKAVLFGILLASMMIPFQVLLVPLFGLMYDIGWLNSYKAIIIPFSVGAFGVFLMRQFIVTIPSELMDAARIDGCSEFGIYYRIVLPIIKPALGALTIYSFLSSWNGYLWPLIVLRDEAKYTLPIGLANLIGIYRQDYGMLMAGTLLSLLPIIILFLAMQREFVQGITLGGVKE